MVVVGHVDVHVVPHKDSFNNDINFIRPEIFCRQKKFGSPPIGKGANNTKNINIMSTEVKEVKEVQTIVERTASRNEIVSNMIKENPLHYVVDTTALTFHAQINKRKDGLGNYINVSVHTTEGVKRFNEQEDGSVILQLSKHTLISQYDIINLMQADSYYNSLASRTAQDFALDAEMNPDPRNPENEYFTDVYLKDVPVKILCQFVDAGEISKNPFSYSAEPYEVKSVPRYIYHLISLDKPTNAESLVFIANIKARITEEKLAKRAAMIEARKQTAKVIASLETPKVEAPF